MKKIMFLCGIALIGVNMVSCDKTEETVAPSPAAHEVTYQYDVNNVPEIIRLADEDVYHEVYGKDGKPSSNKIGGGVEVIYDGIFSSCGDGSAECVPPRNACGVIVYGLASTDDGKTVYENGTLIKILPDAPIAQSFERLVKASGDAAAEVSQCGISGNVTLSILQ